MTLHVGNEFYILLTHCPGFPGGEEVFFSECGITAGLGVTDECKRQKTAKAGILFDLKDGMCTIMGGVFFFGLCYGRA